MQVTEIVLKASDDSTAEPIVPDFGKVQLSYNGIFLGWVDRRRPPPKPQTPSAGRGGLQQGQFTFFGGKKPGTNPLDSRAR